MMRRGLFAGLAALPFAGGVMARTEERKGTPAALPRAPLRAYC